MNTTPSTPPVTDTFRYDPGNRAVLRDSDGEAMATIDKAGVLTFTHHSRERNYGGEIRELLNAAGVAFTEPAAKAETPPAPSPGPTELPPAPVPAGKPPEPPPANATPPPAAPKATKPAKRPPAAPGDPEPERHPQLGAYTASHLHWDHVHLDDERFLAKWGGSMTLTTKRMAETLAKTSFAAAAADIIERIS